MVDLTEEAQPDLSLQISLHHEHRNLDLISSESTNSIYQEEIQLQQKLNPCIIDHHNTSSRNRSKLYNQNAVWPDPSVTNHITQPHDSAGPSRSTATISTDLCLASAPALQTSCSGGTDQSAGTIDTVTTCSAAAAAAAMNHDNSISTSPIVNYDPNPNPNPNPSRSPNPNTETTSKSKGDHRSSHAMSPPPAAPAPPRREEHYNGGRRSHKKKRISTARRCEEEEGEEVEEEEEEE